MGDPVTTQRRIPPASPSAAQSVLFALLAALPVTVAASVPDGLSNTIVVAEKYARVERIEPDPWTLRRGGPGSLLVWTTNDFLTTDVDGPLRLPEVRILLPAPPHQGRRTGARKALRAGEPPAGGGDPEDPVIQGSPSNTPMVGEVLPVRLERVEPDPMTLRNGGPGSLYIWVTVGILEGLEPGWRLPEARLITEGPRGRREVRLSGVTLTRAPAGAGSHAAGESSPAP